MEKTTNKTIPIIIMMLALILGHTLQASDDRESSPDSVMSIEEESEWLNLSSKKQTARGISPTVDERIVPGGTANEVADKAYTQPIQEMAQNEKRHEEPMQQEINALKAMVQKLEKQLAKVTQDSDKKIQKATEAMQQEINELKAKLDSSIQEVGQLKQSIDKNIKDIQGDIQSLKQEVIKGVTKEIKQLIQSNNQNNHTAQKSNGSTVIVTAAQGIGASISALGLGYWLFTKVKEKLEGKSK